MSVNFDGIYYGMYRGRENLVTKAELTEALNSLESSLVDFMNSIIPGEVDVKYATKGEVSQQIADASEMLMRKFDEAKVIQPNPNYPTTVEVQNMINEWGNALLGLINEKEIVEPEGSEFIKNNQMVEYVTNAVNNVRDQLSDLINSVNELLDELNKEVF